MWSTGALFLLWFTSPLPVDYIMPKTYMVNTQGSAKGGEKLLKEVWGHETNFARSQFAVTETASETKFERLRKCLFFREFWRSLFPESSNFCKFDWIVRELCVCSTRERDYLKATRSGANWDLESSNTLWNPAWWWKSVAQKPWTRTRSLIEISWGQRKRPDMATWMLGAPSREVVLENHRGLKWTAS